MSSTVTWLRARTDAEIAELLAARPDLLLPAPPDVATLARRVDATATVRRAIGTCTAFELQILQAIWVLTGAPARVGDKALAGASRRKHTPTPEGAPARVGDSPGATPAAVAKFLGGPATGADVARAIAHLQLLAVVRLVGARYQLGPTTAEALGRFPGGLAPASPDPTRGHGAPSGLGRESTAGPNSPASGVPNHGTSSYEVTGADIARALKATDEAGLALLRKLVPGPPLGSAPADSPQRAVIAQLVAAGLLREFGDGTVLLPQEVALALRGRRPLGPALPEPPPFALTPHPVGTVDGAAAGQALAGHAMSVRLLDLLGSGAVHALKTGGIGVTALRSITQQLDTSAAEVALHLELLHACGLIAPALAKGRTSAIWLPTQAADTFLAGTESGGWALLVATWLDLRRDPSRIGARDEADKPINVLSVQADWRRGPTDRRLVLREIGSMAPDVAASQPSVVARLRYAMPLANGEALAQLAKTVLAEATSLGLVAFDALSTPGRAILDDDIEGAAAALERSLPAPVEKVVVQADMTIIAPGRLTSDLAAALAEMADVESLGSGAVYRLGEATIRRALDAGATRAELHRLLEKHSSTPIPQSVTYLIDDVARRHGVLRASSVEAVVHSEDGALIQAAVAAAAAAGIGLRLLAPTVAVSPVDLETLIEALRNAGLAPAAEDGRGALIDLRPAPQRTRAAMPPRVPHVEPSAPSPEQIAAVVRRMRASDRAQATGPDAARNRTSDPSDIVTLLREAAHTRAPVWIGYADAEGGVSTRAVEPIVVSGGTMLAFDKLRNAPRTFILSRVSAAHTD